MIPEVSDLFSLLTAVHHTIDAMVEDLSDEQWTTKPSENMNNVASIIHHIVLVERRFMNVLSGSSEAIDTQAPFKADTWDVAAIKAEWSSVLPDVQQVLDTLTAEQLPQYAAKLGIGEVNKRQLVAYTIAHTTHHRGQIPIVKKLILS